MENITWAQTGRKHTNMAIISDRDMKDTLLAGIESKIDTLDKTRLELEDKGMEYLKKSREMLKEIDKLTDFRDEVINESGH